MQEGDDLVAAADFNDGLEKGEVVLEVVLIDQLLPRPQVVCHEQRGEEGADLAHLSLHALGLGQRRRVAVDLVRVG